MSENNPRLEKKVVIIDDEELLLDLFRAIVESEGHKVNAFTNPVSALEYFKKNGKSVDVLISDINMGSNIDGFDLVSQVEPYNGSIKKYLMTGNLSQEYAKKLQELKQNRVIAGFLYKPFKPESISEILR